MEIETLHNNIYWLGNSVQNVRKRSYECECLLHQRSGPESDNRNNNNPHNASKEKQRKMLSLKNIHVKNIINGASLEVKEGELILIIGANGSGKSTLLNTISGVTKQDEGEIVINGIDISNLSQRKRTHWISTVPQDTKFATIPEMTILENMNLAYFRRNNKKLRLKDAEYFREKLSIFGMNLENRLSDYVKNLSGGQRQILSLVMSTISDYDLLLLDEITSALEPKVSDLSMEFISKSIAEEKKMCLLITHTTKYIESAKVRTLRMEGGKLVEIN